MIKIIQNINGVLSRSKSSGLEIVQEDVESQLKNSAAIFVSPRRQASRLAVSVAVWYRSRFTRDNRWILTRSRNYSSKGVRIVLSQELAPGTEVSLKLKLPNYEHPISIQGVVLWVAPYFPYSSSDAKIECGIAFKDSRKVPHKDKLTMMFGQQLEKVGLQYTRHLTAQPVQTLSDLKTCYQLVYQAYLNRGYCLANSLLMHYSYYCFLPKSRTFILKESEKMLGTMSLFIDTPCGLPMDSLFSKELNDLRSQGRCLSEVSLLSMAAQDANREKKTVTVSNFEQQMKFFRLIKIMIEYARFGGGATDLIIGVHPKHESIYRFMQFERIGPVRNYDGARGSPALPMRLDLIKAVKTWPKSLKIFFLEEMTPLETIRSYINLSPELIKEFLTGTNPVWDNIPPQAKDYLQRCYPFLQSVPKPLLDLGEHAE